jgi:hypothetical protein
MNAVASEAFCQVHPNFDQVCDFFRSSSYPHLASFVAKVQNAEVVLEGESPSFHSKQLAQNVAARCPGVTRVKNFIKVNYVR